MPNEPQEIYTVSQLNAKARYLMEESFQTIHLIGEISNLAQPSSGHFYFSLKDQNAQVRCALFRHSQRGLNFKPKNGQQVLVQAQVSLYEARGDFQLIISTMQLSGEGALQIAFEKLKQKLAAEGLFDEENKLPIPDFSTCVGVITSSTGAAIRDILHVLERRFPALPIIIYPSAVQGDQASAQLVSAIQKANQRQECDVLILARGGGSLEDLWPFNEEIVARAIFESDIPIVTGVGHEVDFTIADFVADQRCPTPSAAAEWISPDIEEWQGTLKRYADTFIHIIKSLFKHAQQELTHLKKRLQHPGQRLQQQMQTIDQMEARLLKTMCHQLQLQQEKLRLMAKNLDAINPLNTLKRGYAIVTKNNTLITNTLQVKPGDRITAQLAEGTLNCIVE